MANMFDSFKDSINKGVATVSGKSGSLKEKTLIKTAISNAQKQMASELNELGVRFYNTWKAGSASVDTFTEDFQRIQGYEKEIEGLKERLEQIKEEEEKLLGSGQKAPAGGSIFCTNCGKALPAGSRFCDECGAPLS